MTRQIADATEAMERNQQQLENAKTYLESILSNLTSGVLTFDERHYLKTVNATAYEILGVPAGAFHGLKLQDWTTHVATVSPSRRSCSSTSRRPRPASGSSSWSTGATTARERSSCAARTSRRAATRDTSWSSTTSRTSRRRSVTRRGERSLAASPRDQEPPDTDPAFGRAPAAQAAAELPKWTPMSSSGHRHDREPGDRAQGHGGRLQPVRARFADDRGAGLAQRLVREVLVLYESMGVPIEPQLAENLPRVAADPALLRQVLHNLIQNAIDALVGADQPRIVVTSALAAEASRCRSATTGRDRGSGPRPDLRALLTPSPRHGLGLAIVKKIVEEHHGHIVVENVKPTAHT